MGGSFRPRDKPSIHSIDTKPGETQISTTPPLSPLPKVQCLVSSRIPFDSGEYRLLLYKNHMDQYNHLALVFGAISSLSLHDDSLTLVGRQQRGAIDVHPAPQKAVMVRIHSCCFTGETVGSLRCDCGEQLTTAMHAMAAENCGVVLYMQQEGRGIGLMDKLFAYNLIDMGHDTLSANQALGFRGDEREYSQCASMLADLQISRVELLTNNPQKAAALEKAGIIVEKRVEMMPKTWALEGHIVQDRDAYLVTKIKRMGHQLSVPSLIERQVTNSES